MGRTLRGLSGQIISKTVITDWTAVAQNAVAKSSVIDIKNGASITLQAFLDTETAHTGTEFIVQTTKEDSGDEDWEDLVSFAALVGTANAEPITNNPLAAGSTTITCDLTTGYTTGNAALPWRAIEDATLVNSELIRQKGYTSNTSITILDGTANAHVVNTNMYNIAISELIAIPVGVGRRARVVVNNTYDSDGSTLNYRVVA